MRNPEWEFIKNFYQNVLKTPKDIVENIAVFDILSLSVKGFSNTFISEQLQMDKRYIRDVLIEFLNFRGWKNDLDLSPIDVYNRCQGHYICYRHECNTISALFTNEDIDVSHTICKIYTKIKKGLNDYYGENTVT